MKKQHKYFSVRKQEIKMSKNAKLINKAKPEFEREMSL